MLNLNSRDLNKLVWHGKAVCVPIEVLTVQFYLSSGALGGGGGNSPLLYKKTALPAACKT